jgi:hypothetical protein
MAATGVVAAGVTAGMAATGVVAAGVTAGMAATRAARSSSININN